MISKNKVIKMGNQLGFDVVKVSSADPFPEYKRIVKERIQAGFYPAELMGHERILEQADIYADPANSLPGAKSIISMAFCYYTADSPDLTRPGEPHGVLARVNQRNISREIHYRQIKLAEQLRKKGIKVSKTNYVPYKIAAVRAGIGWQGKNSLIINEEYGSWISLCSLVIGVEYDPDESSSQSCGTCQACQKVCPTSAIQSPGVVNGSKCLDYITGKTGVVPREHRNGMGNKLVSCDLCHEACPHNKSVKPTSKGISNFSSDLAHSPALIPLLHISDEQFKRDFSYHGFIDLQSDYLKRNVIIALGNIGDPVAIPSLKKVLHEGTPLIKRHAAWALGEIKNQSAIHVLKDAIKHEQDITVREDILGAINNNPGRNNK